MKNFDQVAQAIAKELDRARGLHEWPDCQFAAMNILVEEVGEAVKALNNYRHHGEPKEEIIKEAIEAGAMIFRFLLETKGIRHDERNTSNISDFW